MFGGIGIGLVLAWWDALDVDGEGDSDRYHDEDDEACAPSLLLADDPTADPAPEAASLALSAAGLNGVA